jgi:DNA polymerase-3 subunit beta
MPPSLLPEQLSYLQLPYLREHYAATAQQAAQGHWDHVEYLQRLIEGEFPNYRQLIPASHPNTLTVEREPLLEAIRRVKILAKDATPVRLQMGGDTLRLTAITQDVGNASEELDATYEGTELTVAFNPEYFASGVEACSSDSITLSTLDSLKPAVVRGVGNDDYLYLLMPVRVP